MNEPPKRCTKCGQSELLAATSCRDSQGHLWPPTLEPPRDVREIARTLSDVLRFYAASPDRAGVLKRDGESAVATALTDYAQAERTRAEAAERGLAQVAGETEWCAAQIEARSRMLITEEQEKLAPDNALIGLLCEVVRWIRLDRVLLEPTPSDTQGDGE